MVNRYLTINCIFQTILRLILLVPVSSISSGAEPDKPNEGIPNIVNMAFVDHKPPYSSSPNSGIEIDLARSALSAVNLKLRVHFFAKDKFHLALEGGRVDAVVTSFDWNDQHYESNTFISYHNYAITKKKRNIRLSNINEISHYRSAAWKNAHMHLGDEFKNVFKPILATRNPDYLELSNQTNQCRMFWLDRLDVIIIDRSIFEWCKTQLPNIDTDQDVEYHALFSIPSNYPVLFKSERLRNLFNKGLESLHRNKSYEAIYKKHLTTSISK